MSGDDSGSSMPSPDPEEAIIQCHDVTHRYHRGRRRSILPWRSSDRSPTVTALEDVSLTVTHGSAVGLRGPSGSGKSTLLHLIAGLTTPSDGQILLNGTNLAEATQKARLRLRRDNIGFVFQRFHLLPALSARANVALPLVQLGVSRTNRRERAESLLEAVGLEDRRSHTPDMLSGGEQQRVAIARALVTDPAVILADEPTGELDSETSETVLRLLTEITDDRAVVIASHDELAIEATDRIHTLHDGRVVVPNGD